MKYVSINPGKLGGQIKVPPSKSVCHRALICASLCSGISNIGNVDFSEDIEATCGALESLGVDIKKGKNYLTVKGNPNLYVRKSSVHCFQSGSTLRFLIPLAATLDEEITFTGEGKLVERPLNPYYNIFDSQKISYKNSNGKLPLTVSGKLNPGNYKVSGNISSQFITGLLFALPLLEGDSKIEITTELESKSYVDITVDVLEKFGVYVDGSSYKEFIVQGNQTYKEIDCNIEGDFSQAAFWLVMGALGNGITCRGLDMDSLQGDRVIVHILKEMGVKIEEREDSIEVKPSKVCGTVIDVSQCPDLVPVLAALASVSCGTTEIINAARLRIKESDRLKAITSELNKIGADVIEKEDGLVIHGKEKLKGGNVSSWRDHRIAMALAAVSSRCTEPLIIKEAEHVRKSYPGFWQDFRNLGGKIDEWSVGE
ncbi:3-phosphoshikimate 1-carboxyvinyltransferase [Clostridium sp. WILCCON 0269]|uniref:3-phosphoshikimate 1-carboxyvinyltransferase n=1 Tax=Candidatus Clostridium eludens TaxID=3381663 RepID=A0ABW8SKW6_9CLOT